MGPADRMAVFSLPSGPRLDFSADRAAIEKTLDSIGPLRESMVNGEFSISYTEALGYAQGRARGLESPIALTGVLRRTSSHAAGPPRVEACALRVEAEARRLVNDQEAQRRATVSTRWRRCARRSAGVPGPKQLVLVSGASRAPSRAATTVGPQLRRIADAAAAASVNIYSVYFSQRFAAMRRVEGAGERDGRGGPPHARRPASSSSPAWPAARCSRPSPERAFAFERVATETSGHYLLSLEPGKRDRDGKPHDIEVKVVAPGRPRAARASSS